LDKGGGYNIITNDEYTENVEFFSKYESKLDTILKLNYTIIDGKWYYTYLSSNEEAIHELWTVNK